MRPSQRPALALLLGGVVLCSFFVLTTRMSLGKGMEETSLRLANNCTVWAAGAILWPVLWINVVGIDVAAHTPMAMLGLAWPPCMLFLDLLFVPHQASGQKEITSYDANVLTSLAFAMGGLLVTSGLGKNFVRAASPILSSCVFLVIAFCICTPSMKEGTQARGVVKAIQKVCLSWCVGLLLTAVGINLQVGVQHKDAQGREILKVNPLPVPKGK